MAAKIGIWNVGMVLRTDTQTDNIGKLLYRFYILFFFTFTDSKIGHYLCMYKKGVQELDTQTNEVGKLLYRFSHFYFSVSIRVVPLSLCGHYGTS